jgi:hypothetical protein
MSPPSLILSPFSPFGRFDKSRIYSIVNIGQLFLRPHPPLKTDLKSRQKYEKHFPDCDLQLFEQVREVRTTSMFYSSI